MVSEKNKSPVETTPVMVRMSGDMIAAIDRLRRMQEDPPSRPEMIRQLVEMQLQQQG